MIAPGDVAVAVILGGGFAAGILLMLMALPRWRAVTLSVRIAPYLRHVVADGALPPGVLPTIGALPASAVSGAERVRAQLGRLLGGEAPLTLRLGQAGENPDAARFRGRQLIAGVVGLCLGAVAAIGLALAGRMSVPAALLPILMGVGAVILLDVRLSTRARARLARLDEELPTTLEFLGLCLAAGESVLDTLRRVASVGSGELTEEFAQVVLATNTGSSLAEALGDMARRLQSPPVTRAVDHLVAALERGAPLAGVLQAQASDAREDAKRLLIEQAGRKEIAMMLPLVFLILPLSVVFAVFPGLFLFQFGLS